VEAGELHRQQDHDAAGPANVAEIVVSLAGLRGALSAVTQLAYGGVAVRLRRRTKLERLRDRGDSRRLIRILDKHDWLVDRDGMARDLAVGRRVEAVKALGTINTDHAEEGVVRALEDDDPRVRLAAVEALRSDPSVLAAETLARTAARWRDVGYERERAAAVGLLIELDDERLAVVYAQALVNDPERNELTVQDEHDLGRLFAKSGGEESSALGERLTQQLAAPDAKRRRRAHQALIGLGSTAVVPLIGALQDPARQDLACAALGRIRDTRAVPALVRVLGNGEPQVRVEAARALGDIRDGGALEALVHAAGDADARVRDAALEALDKLRSLVAGLGAAALVESYENAGLEGQQPLPSVRRTPANGHDRRAILRRLLGR
jgi:HEAT repeat protein